VEEKMKRLIYGILVLGLILIITSCGQTEKSQIEPSIQDQNSTEPNTNATQLGENTDQNDDAEDKIPIVASKKGQELIDSLEIKTPEKLYVKGTSYSEDIVVETATYVYNENYRTESKSSLGEQVAIYNSEEGALYLFSLADGTGMVYYDDDELDMLDEDEDEEYIEAEVVLGEELFADLGDMLVSAEIIDYKGYETVFIETASTSIDGEWKTRQWISTQYWYPIKFESVFNGVIIGGYDADEITTDFQITDDLFRVPADITIVDMDALLNFDFYDVEDED
jgi:hypothetical protein